MIENENTYATALANNSLDEFHKKFDEAINKIRKDPVKDYPNIINGNAVYSENKFTVKSPADSSISVANFPNSTEDEVNISLESAKKAFPEWSSVPYQKRVQIFRECADNFFANKFNLAAILSFENGKNRLESESTGVIEANGSAVAHANTDEFARFRSHTEGESASQSLNLRDWLDLAEAWRIMQALHACQGNRSAAARALGIGRRTLYAKMEKLGITPTWRFGDPTARQSPASFAKP